MRRRSSLLATSCCGAKNHALMACIPSLLHIAAPADPRPSWRLGRAPRVSAEGPDPCSAKPPQVCPERGLQPVEQVDLQVLPVSMDGVDRPCRGRPGLLHGHVRHRLQGCIVWQGEVQVACVGWPRHARWIIYAPAG
eukprot:353182-Chlamydomonas_euryale.AAC.54